MADVVSEFDFVPGTNGSPSLLYYVECHLGDSEVERIDLVFPPGCAGLVAARVEFAINPVYPSANGQWFIFDDYVVSIPVSGQGNSGQWRISGYNTDIYTHVIRGYFYWNRLPVKSRGPSTPLLAL